jgi:hypothetical protein
LRASAAKAAARVFRALRTGQVVSAQQFWRPLQDLHELRTQGRRPQHTIQEMGRCNIGTIHKRTSLPSSRTFAGLVRLEEIAMKTIWSALVAFSVIAGVAGSAKALDAKTFYEQFDRSHYAKNDDWTAWGGAMRGLDR